MRVDVRGGNLLADVTRAALVDHVTVTSWAPDVYWLCENEQLEPEPGATILVSYQALVGTSARLQKKWPENPVCYSPENIRRATALEDFRNQSRVVIGGDYQKQLETLFAPFCSRVLWMSWESAEMVKHALNTFLALCVRFGNEIGELCETVGANPRDVVAGLTTERRVGRHAPIHPGDEPSEHLMREVNRLVELGAGPTIRSLL